MSVELLSLLAKTGLRVFDMDDLAIAAASLGFQKKSYALKLASMMVRRGELISLHKGLYALPTEFLAGGPLHSFEIALTLAKKGAISHRSALSYHELTDQVFSKVTVTVPKEKGSNLSSTKDYEINSTDYQLIRIAPQHYWGIMAVFLGEAKVWIADLERTLIDGLMRPELCGGFREVFFAFERASTVITPAVILEYALKSSLVVCKRLGWVFEQLSLHKDIQEKLLNLPMSYCQKLDASGKRKGKVIQPWNLLENI